MASFSDRVKVVIDVVSDGASSGLSKFRRDLDAADTRMGKFKVATSGAFDYVKKNAAGFAIGAGSALAVFGAKAVGEFTDSAIAAGQFADATGLSVEQASKWNSVADDLGLNADTLQKSFLRLNKELGEGNTTADEYGITQRKLADGTVDVNGTMLDAIDVIGSIQDPTEKAAVAQELFGRSYAEVAEIILGDSKEIEKALESTSEAQIIDEDELRKARDYRASMDRLKDVLTDLTMVAGEALTPTLGAVADTIADIDNGLKDVLGEESGIGGLVKAGTDVAGAPLKAMMDYNKAIAGFVGIGGEAKWTAEELAAAAEYLTEEMDTQLESLDAVTEAVIEEYKAKQDLEEGTIDVAKAHEAATEELERSVKATFDAIEADKELRNEQRKMADTTYDVADAQDDLYDSVKTAEAVLDDEEATMRDAASAMRDVARDADALATKQVELAGETLDTRQGMDIWNREMLTVASTLKGPMRAEVLNHIARVNGIPTDRVTEVDAVLDGGSIADAEYRLNYLARNRESTLTVRKISTGGSNSFYAKGTEGSRGGTALVGEQGPELVNLPAGSQVLRAPETREALRGAGGSGGTVIINVPKGMRADDVAKLERTYSRRNGPR